MKTIRKADLFHFLTKEIKKIKYEIDQKESNLFDHYSETCRISFFVNSNRVDLDIEIYNDYLFQCVNENYLINTLFEQSNFVLKEGFINVYKYLTLNKHTDIEFTYLDLENVDKIEIIKAREHEHGYEDQKVLTLKRVRQKYKVNKYRYRFLDSDKYYYL